MKSIIYPGSLSLSKCFCFIIRSLAQPSCSKVEIDGNSIKYTIEKELGIELIGDTKVRISVDENEESWDNIIDEKEIDNNIEENVQEESIKEEQTDFLEDNN